MSLTLSSLEAQAIAELRPATHLERWFASEIAYAKWELDRVRDNRNHTAAEPRLLAAYNRASRNWNRARRELESLQKTRVNQSTLLSPSRAQAAERTPLADPARSPQPKLGRPMVDHLLKLISTGILDTKAIRITARQEAR